MPLNFKSPRYSALPVTLSLASRRGCDFPTISWSSIRSAESFDISFAANISLDHSTCSQFFHLAFAQSQFVPVNFLIVLAHLWRRPSDLQSLSIHHSETSGVSQGLAGN